MSGSGANEVPGWAPGKRVGAYTLLRELARGGMAEIWLARQQGAGGFDRVVVIKRILRSSEDDESHLSLFLDEARIAAQLSHPNIVQVFDFTEAEGSYALVMEYLAGLSLSKTARAIFAKRGTVDPFTAALLVAQAAAGLGHAHQKKGLDGKPLGIVHRDVSPQNLFVTWDGHVKVLDFGIALARGRASKTATGTVRGKLAYMAPEQALGQPVEAPADVFALGVILFELLTGTRLYGRAEEIQILRTLTGDSAWPGPREVLPSVPAELDAIVRRCLERDPAQRYPDAKALEQALDAFVKAHPPPPLEATMRQYFAEQIAQQDTLFEGIDLLTPRAGNATAQVERSLTGKPPPERAQPEGTGVHTFGPTLEQRLRGRPWTLPVALLVVAVVVAGAWAVGRGEGRPSTPLGGSGATALKDGGGTAQVERSRDPAGPSTSPGVSGATAPGDGGSTAQVERGGDPAGPSTPLGVNGATADPKKPPPAAVAAKGKLSLDTTPWTRVFLGKTALGDTPLLEVPLPVGTHRLRLVNEEEHVSSVVEVDIEAGRTTVKRLSLQ